jgi:hypothetical protein
VAQTDIHPKHKTARSAMLNEKGTSAIKGGMNHTQELIHRLSAMEVLKRCPCKSSS